jgi:hypothetical protein
VVNVIWGLVNFIIAFVLLQWAGACNMGYDWKTLAFALGAAVTSIALAITFDRLDRS